MATVANEKRCRGTLHQVIIAVLLLVLGFLLSPNGQHVVGEDDLDILLIDAGQFCRDLNLVLGFADVDLRHQSFHRHAAKSDQGGSACRNP